ncbi:hypothetical protein DA83_23410 [Pseudomonas sp. 250J]|uniref:DUF2857 domain-containing protein n=1 Tax=Pseudomonas TaxID=286 RepID=UPI00067FE00F|nr:MULTISPECIES: DUF2857 domain-containing protein [Pseudomonas]KNX78292.1 hypothetical protein DA83_23410 [Pseudomonas sp. 250J]MBS9759852.1 DUF2857 domain-containing protein [Pseudomonas mosselii]
MSKSTLNEAVLSQLLDLMRNGQLQRCVEMGVEPEVLGQIQHPTVLSLLRNTPVSWVTVSINSSMILKLLTGAARTEEETRLIERAIRLGATTSLLGKFFGLTPQEIALQRTVIGVRAPRGRWPELSEDQDHHIWHRWTKLMDAHRVDLEDSMAMLDVAMLVAEELSTDGLTLAQIWSRITQWVEQGLYPGSKERPRATERRQLTLLDEGGVRRVDESCTASSHLGEGDHRR